MIAQARITSDTSATVHLQHDAVDLSGADLSELRARVKDVFIGAAREAGGSIDVVIVEPDIQHHLRVEPSGRITGRVADDRPLYGPSLDGAAAADGPVVEPDPSTATHRLPVVPPAPASADEADSPAPTPEDTDISEQPGREADTADPATPATPETEPADGPDGSVPAQARPRRPLPSLADAEGRPTLQDLQQSTARPEKVKASKGWRRTLSRLTGGAISLGPGRRERYELDRLERLRRTLDGPRNIVVVNLKGGAHKTTASLMIAATLGIARGGGVLAWDNNETRGTLGWRGLPTDHSRTAVDLLHDIDRLRAVEASAAELDPYVRPQGEMHFDILASDEDPGSMAMIDDTAFGELNTALSRFYRLMVIDTGNNVRASNWLASVRDADQLVIISTVREDTFNAAAWMIDELRATGMSEQVDNAVTILSHSSKGKFDPTLRKRLLAHFGAHTRAVAEVPYEQQFVDGSHLQWSKISPATKEAWMDATAQIVDGL